MCNIVNRVNVRARHTLASRGGCDSYTWQQWLWLLQLILRDEPDATSLNSYTKDLCVFGIILFPHCFLKQK